MGRFERTFNGASLEPFRFLADDATLTAGQALKVTNSKIARVFESEECLITMTARAASASTAKVRFGFVGHCHPNAPYGTVADFTLELTLNGTDQVYVSKIVDTVPYTELKLLEIINGDPAVALAGVNVTLTYKH